jgi:hypothetical protein
MAGMAVGWKDGVGWVDAQGNPAEPPDSRKGIGGGALGEQLDPAQSNAIDAAAKGNTNPAVGWQDGRGWVDKDGRPTNAGKPANETALRDMAQKSAAEAPPINLSKGWDQAGDYRNGAESSTYRPGVDDHVWNKVLQPSAYQYGGEPGVADFEEERYAGMARNADTRLAPQISENTYGRQFGGDMGLDLESRGNQLYGLQQLQGMIEGRGPSVAQQQMNMGLAQAMRQQASIAASARGGGANLASAQQAASNAAAGLSGNAFAQGALLRAQETTSAINNYGGLANLVRTGDATRAGMNADLAKSQADIAVKNKAINDARNMYYEDARKDVFKTQMGARQAGEAANAGVYTSDADRAQQQGQHEDDRVDKYAGGVASLLGTGFAAISDVRAKKDIRPAGASMDRTLDGLGSYEYNYKDPARHGEGRQTGTMAQQLAATPLGASAVASGPDGLYIKGPQATNLTLSGLARLNERVRAVEATTGTVTPGRGLAAITPVPANQVPDQRDFPAEQAEMRGLSAMAQQNQPVSAGTLQPADFGDERMNAAGNAALVEHIAAQRRPVTLAEYQAIAKMPSSPEVDLFRQRPEFQGYGNVEGYAEPLPALRGSGLARITPPKARTARR